MEYDFVDNVQSLMDLGIRKKEISRRMGVHHEVISRTIRIHNLEWYVPYDETHTNNPIEVSDWECEDILEEIINEVFDEGRCLLSRTKISTISKYLKEQYGSFRDYVYTKDYRVLLEQSILLECSRCGTKKPIIEFSRREDNPLGYDTQCRECGIARFRQWEKQNPSKFKNCQKENSQVRRAVEANLPSARKYGVGSRCLLTYVEDIHHDHFIPIAIGHGGTYKGNMIPLKGKLNRNKSDENPFTWFETNRQRFKLDQSRFDAVVADLANQNGLTPVEYRQYVDWCFVNKRSLDDIIADNKRYGYVVTSVELWRDSTGIQLPLLFDNREQTFEAEEAA